MQETPQPLLEIKQLNTEFSRSTGFLKPKKIVHAVKNVSLKIQQGETFGLVGESGCGKSTLGRTILRLYQPTSGQIFYQGQEISHLSEKALKLYRKEMQSIFQDPLSSLNPHMTVEQLVGESLQIHGMYHGAHQKNEKKQYIVSILEKVGLQSAHLLRFPHEFSGGQRQRISIARALAVNPKFILCDEPLSALDVSVQAQVVNLLQDLQEELGITYLFIAHDLAMVKHISHHIGVMFLGGLVETGTSSELYANPSHPYTQALLNAVPKVPDAKTWKGINKGNEGQIFTTELTDNKQDPTVSSLHTEIKGCLFAPRCPFAKPICYKEIPRTTLLSKTHAVTCHLYQ